MSGPRALWRRLVRALRPGGRPAAAPPPVRSLRLVEVGELAADLPLLAWLAGALADRLGTPAAPGAPLPLHPDWHDPERGQFSSNRIVDALVERSLAGRDTLPDHWTLAVTREDIFAPGRSFVFGEATLGGCWALISLARLRPGTEADAGRLPARALTEALHEIGHLAGLGHCPDPGCAMFPSRGLAETDRKGARLCAVCHTRLRERLAGS